MLLSILKLALIVLTCGEAKNEANPFQVASRRSSKFRDQIMMPSEESCKRFILRVTYCRVYYGQSFVHNGQYYSNIGQFYTHSGQPVLGWRCSGFLWYV